MAGEMRPGSPARRGAGGKAPPWRHQQDRALFRRSLYAFLEPSGRKLAFRANTDEMGPPGRGQRQLPGEQPQIITETDQFPPGIGESQGTQSDTGALYVRFFADKFLLPRDRGQQLPGREARKKRG